AVAVAGRSAAGAALWVGVALVYTGIREPAPQNTPTVTTEDDDTGTLGQMLGLLREDKPFRHFVVVRSLLLVSSLSPPFVVLLSVQYGADTLAGLGGFILASGLAALIGGRIFGPVADRSSKRLMTLGAAVASGLVLTRSDE